MNVIYCFRRSVRRKKYQILVKWKQLHLCIAKLFANLTAVITVVDEDRVSIDKELNKNTQIKFLEIVLAFLVLMKAREFFFYLIKNTEKWRMYK